MTEDKLHTIITMAPAFDERNPDPSKNCGIHCVDIRFILKGPRGAVQFVMYTGWHLPHVQEQWKGDADKLWLLTQPNGVDVGYHAYEPQYEGQQPMGPCEYLDGQPCYYDGSGLRADEQALPILLEKGSEGIWEYLLEEYNARFVDGPDKLTMKNVCMGELLHAMLGPAKEENQEGCSSHLDNGHCEALNAPCENPWFAKNGEHGLVCKEATEILED